MVDLLSNAQAWLSDVRKTHLATDKVITYVFKATNTRLNLTEEGVVIGSAGERIDSSIASTFDVEERDYIIPVAAFERQILDITIRPARGDLIEETQADGRVRSYKVVPQGGEVAWEWHDRERTAFRVHCHFVGEV